MHRIIKQATVIISDQQPQDSVDLTLYNVPIILLSYPCKVQPAGIQNVM